MFIKAVKYIRNKEAFTMIELAIVIIIIGLLIGGIVVSNKMVSLSRLTNARTLTNSSPVNNIENLRVWLETTSKKSFDSSERVDNTNITTWYDINPMLTSKHDLTQASSSLQPAYIESGISGLPALNFDSDVISRSDSLGMTGQVEITIIMVIKSDSDNGRRTLKIGGNTSTGSFAILTGLGTVSFAHQNGLIDTNYTMTSSPTILVITRDGSAAHGDSVGGDKLYVNGVAQTNVANSDPDTLGFIDTEFDVGAQDSTGTNPYDGMIGEIIIYDRVISPFERNQVEEYLSKKWKISLN